MKWLKKLVLTRTGRVKILWTITFFFLVMTFLMGLAHPILISSFDKQQNKILSSQKDDPLYDSWYRGQKDLAEIQGYGDKFKDPREVKKESFLSASWKWGIGFIIFFVASLIYTSAATAGGSFDLIKQKVKDRSERGRSFLWFWILLTAILTGAAVIYGEYKVIKGGLKESENMAARFVGAMRKIFKGVEP